MSKNIFETNCPRELRKELWTRRHQTKKRRCFYVNRTISFQDTHFFPKSEKFTWKYMKIYAYGHPHEKYPSTCKIQKSHLTFSILVQSKIPWRWKISFFYVFWKYFFHDFQNFRPKILKIFFWSRGPKKKCDIPTFSNIFECNKIKKSKNRSRVATCKSFKNKISRKLIFCF